MRLGASALALLVTGAGVAAEQLPVVAILLSEPLDREIAAFRGKLEELGYQDGGDVRLVIRNAEGRLERLAGLAAEIVAMAPKVIVSLDCAADTRGYRCDCRDPDRDGVRRSDRPRLHIQPRSPRR